MRILMVSSEATPFAKTGGLAEVVGSLPHALAKVGDQAAVVMPKYRSVRPAHTVPVWYTRYVQVGPHRFEVTLDSVSERGTQYFLVDCPVLFDRAGLYDEGGWAYGDNHLRFALLNQVALIVARDYFHADVLHVHDWQTGILAPYLKVNLARDPVFARMRCVFTIHNIGYQGNFGSYAMNDLGLDWSLFTFLGLEFWDQVSFMKAGIVWSDAVTAVSPTYAKEIQTPEYGYSMDGVLRHHSYKLSGIINGVDYSVWNPETDPDIPERYSADDLAGKAACKRALMAELGLAEAPDRPLIGIVSRFADQKGFDLVHGISDWLLSQDVAMTVLGSGDPWVEGVFRHLAAVAPDRFAIRTGYSEPLAHRIEAGADLFLMPSRYEPCGLNQIYSLRYGTVPVVRATGGLDDTVDESTGFKFRDFAPWALQGALEAALAAYRDRDSWRAMMRRGMAKDYSWDASARAYRQLYRSLF